MDFFLWILIGAAIFSLLGWIIWFVFFVWLARIFVRSAEQELNRTFRDLERMLGQVQYGGADKLTPQQRAKIAQMLMQTQSQMGQLDELARQRYDLRMGELSSIAANANIDWTPPP